MAERAYLIKERRRYYAKYWRLVEGERKWTKKTLKTTKRAVANRRFGEFTRILEEDEQTGCKSIDLGAYAQEYLEWVKNNKSEGWYHRQRQYFENHVIPYFGSETPLHGIDIKGIEGYAAHRLATGTVKNTSVNKELASLRKALGKAKEWGHVRSNVAKQVRDLPDDSQSRTRFLSEQEYRFMIAVARQMAAEQEGLPDIFMERFTDLEEMVDIGCFTGLRIGEMLALHFADILWNTNPPLCWIRKKAKKDFGFDFLIKNYQERDGAVGSPGPRRDPEAVEKEACRVGFRLPHA